MADRRLVLIEWEDSHSVHGWEVFDGELEDRALVCHSVGWLVLDGEQIKVVASHLSREHPTVSAQSCGLMTIPARAVLRVVDLVERVP